MKSHHTPFFFTLEDPSCVLVHFIFERHLAVSEELLLPAQIQCIQFENDKAAGSQLSDPAVVRWLFRSEHGIQFLNQSLWRPVLLIKHG